MAVSIMDALDLIYKNTTPLNERETIDTLDSNGRVLACDIIATKSLPGFDNSAMDGYAIKLLMANRTIPCSENILYAGAKTIPQISEDFCIKIMTGAAIPIGCEAVVPFENVTVDESGMVTIPINIKKGANIRFKGEEIKSGNKCLFMGEDINSYTIGLLASQGISKVDVIRKPKVTIISSGDELRDFNDSDIGDFELYNSNTPMFYARTNELGCDSKITQHTNDKIETLQSKIANEIKHSDIIITSGGASSGDKDLTKEAFLNLGMEMIFDKIDIKPGKPTAIGMIDSTMIVILPGNPLAAMVNFELFIVPLIAKLRGSNRYYHTTSRVKLSKDLDIKSGKYSVILGSYDNNVFASLDKQSPNMVSMLKDASGLIITTPNISNITNNQEVIMINLNGKMSKKRVENIFCS